MKANKKLAISGAFTVDVALHHDDRGVFREWFWKEECPFDIAQGNMSVSKANVIRGLHVSVHKLGQSKWITCTSGAITDVIVDLRPKSDTFLTVEKIPISANSGTIICIPSGVAHGFISHKDETTVVYLVSSKYSPGDEVTLNPMDTQLNIDWGVKDFIVSDRDRSALSLDNFLKKYKQALADQI